MHRPAFLLLLLLTALHAVPAFGQDEDSSPHSRAELISEHAWIRPGVPFTVGLRLFMDAGWHSYWQNPGDAGEPTYIEWELPETFETGPIQWPHPYRIEAGPLTSYGYSDEVVLLTDIIPPTDLEPGTTLQIDAVAYWLICEEICLPAEEPVSMLLPVQDEEPPLGEDARTIASARSDHPAKLEDWAIQATSYSGSYVLQLTPPSTSPVDVEGAYFFPTENATLDHAAPQPVSREGDTILIALQQSDYAAGMADRLRGVLVAAEGASWDPAGDIRALGVDVLVEDAEIVSESPASSSSRSIWGLLALAFVGGVLLNLMPCVFPVLSVKILGFAGHGREDEGAMRRHGLLFGVGVIASFWVLASLMLILRAGGSQIGWGFQLQSPYFVAAMALLFFGIGLNLMGVFELGTGVMRWSGRLEQKPSDGATSSFFSGVLATVVATPCTAPFMGVALGASLALPVLQALAIFTLLGLGMAAPYVILSLMPKWLDRLPEPGNWMETLKHILAFPMFATAIWLIWVFGRQAGTDGMAFLLLGMLLLGMALWMIGRWPAIRISSRVRFLTRTLACLLALTALASVYAGASNPPAPAEETARDVGPVWQNFSSETIDQLRAENRPVFIDFTAAWCLTCQVNKRTTLNTETVQSAFREKGVALFQADWTNQDAEITRALEVHGRSGVPLYVLYTGAAENPVLLPEILTERIVLDALERLPVQADSSP